MHDPMSIFYVVLDGNRHRQLSAARQHAHSVAHSRRGRLSTWISSLARKRHR